MNSLLLTLTALFILVLSALFAAPLFIDWNDYRPAFEAHASKLIGRQVKMDGEVHLVVLPAPRLKFDGVRVANADGSLDTPFLEAKSLEAKIDVGTLLTGKVEAHQLTIIDPTLRLHIDGARNGNWTDIGPRRTGTPFVPKDVLLDSVRVTGGTVEIVKEGVSPFVFRNIDGEASAASLAGPYKVWTLNSVFEDVGRWTDWVIHIRPSQSSTGILQIWKDGAYIGGRNGPNTYAGDEEGPYLKLGIYSGPRERDCCKGDRTEKWVYYDSLRIASGPDAVYADVAPR